MSALRDTEGKLNWVLLFEHFPLALKELCRAREFGARHYTKEGKDGATNWRESINGPEHEKFYKGCIRGNVSHNFKTLWGEDRDAVQDNVHHLAFGALNDLMALEYALAKELDDEGHAVPEGEPTLREPVFGEFGFQGNRLTGEPIKKTIYDWSKIPKEFNFMSKNSNGHVYMYKEKPMKNSSYFYSVVYPAYDDTEQSSQKTDVPWENSLEARPTMTLDRIGELNDAI
jgi:hypothetical protein